METQGVKFDYFLKYHHLEEDFKKWMDENAEELIYRFLTDLAKIIYNSKKENKNGR